MCSFIFKVEPLFPPDNPTLPLLFPQQDRIYSIGAENADTDCVAPDTPYAGELPRQHRLPDILP